MSLKGTIKEKVEDELREDLKRGEVEVPDERVHGDYATTVALRLGNERGEDPRELAEKLVEKLDVESSDLVERVEVAGPGYINFFLKKGRMGKNIIENVEELKFESREEKLLVEHTSPNPNKPLHMGTLRCAVLGDSISRIGDFIGYDVEVQNFINDLGRQSATTVYAYKNFLDKLDEGDREKKDDFWIGLLYSKGSQHLEENPRKKKDINEIIQEIEEGKGKNTELKNEIVEKSLKAQLQSSFRTNIFYDLIIFETDVLRSKLYEECIEMMKDLNRVYEVESGEDKGCLVIDISDFEEELGNLKKPYKILVRSDGTATYVAKDIALTMWKFGLIETDFEFSEFLEQPNGEDLWRTGGSERRDFGDADEVINVIGAEQKYPQKVIKCAIEALGFQDESSKFDHMHFKFVYLPGRVSYSGRKGNWVGKHADAVLDRTYELALEEVEKRHAEMEEERREKIAESVAVAAVRYFLLKFGREKEIHFSFEKALDWEGDSGPYLLYATARAHGILEKASGEGEFRELGNESEYELLREMERFPDVIEGAFERREPASLANYLKDLAETFNTFYHKSPVLDAETKPLKKSRLALVRGYTKIMERGLKLLGIEPLKEM